MEEQKVRDNVQENNRKHSKRKNVRGITFLHILQHVSLVAAVVLLVMVFLGAYVIVDTRDGTKAFNLSGEKEKDSFEDSQMFNSLLGSNISDIICYGAIRGQMETDGEFDPGKQVDVTAFADRYNGVSQEYITANYYLNDLIKWAQAGFEYESVNMTGKEEAEFLSKSTIVTSVDLDGYGGGTISYLNSDLTGATKVYSDVSGNFLTTDHFDDFEYDSDTVTTRNVLNNRYSSVDGKNIEDYVSSWGEYADLCNNVEKAAKDLAINYNEYLAYNEYYAADHTNVVYFIRRTIGSKVQIFTNMDTDATTVSGLTKELKDKCDKYVYYDPQNMQYETNTLIEEATVRYILNGYEYAYPENTQIMVGVDTSYSAADQFNQGKNEFGKYVPYVWQYFAGAVLCIVVYLFLLIVITIHEGEVRKKDTGEIVIRLHREDRIPTELMLLGCVALGVGVYYSVLALVLVRSRIDNGSLIIFIGMAALIISLCFSFLYYSLVRRIKAKVIWRESLLNRLFRLFKKWLIYAYNHSAIILRVWIPFVIFVLINVGTVFFMLRVFGNSAILAMLVVLVIFDGAVGYLLYRSSLAKQRILEGIQLIREGNLEHKVKEDGMYGEDLILAKAVNSIGESVREAVETSMKDERLKADLITNVSHDIKTPLTSIINYVDLIKRENVQDAKICEYIEVLDAKSQRLKQLTDDLVEASKISSGNIVLQWEKINLVELLNQTIGEFSEKFKEKALHPVFNAPKNNVYIEADSRRIWRVIENLFNNIFKYALEGTRVYIDMVFTEDEEKGELVILSIKNISAQPLKVNPAELTERFIRGDESRTTEGSGLGLSIAKNLTEVQKGKFEIVMDGDLFKVNMYFPLLKE